MIYESGAVALFACFSKSLQHWRVSVVVVCFQQQFSSKCHNGDHIVFPLMRYCAVLQLILLRFYILYSHSNHCFFNLCQSYSIPICINWYGQFRYFDRFEKGLAITRDAANNHAVFSCKRIRGTIELYNNMLVLIAKYLPGHRARLLKHTHKHLSLCVCVFTFIEPP